MTYLRRGKKFSFSFNNVSWLSFPLQIHSTIIFSICFQQNPTRGNCPWLYSVVKILGSFRPVPSKKVATKPHVATEHLKCGYCN